MRTSDTPLCMICYVPTTTVEFRAIGAAGVGLALCADCESCLRRGDRAAVFAKLDARNEAEQSRGPRMPDAEYRAFINDILDQVCQALARQP